MKKHILLALLGVLILCGCANRYQLTLTNGNVITTRSRPKLDETKRAYHYKDSLGRPATMPAFRVKEIEAL